MGYAELKSGKLDKSGQCKLSGYVMLNDGKKIKIKTEKVQPDGVSTLVAALELKNLGTWNVAVGGGLFTGTFGSYRTRSATIGGVLSAASPRARLQSYPVNINYAPVQAALLPTSEAVTLRNGKWSFNKAAKVT